MELRLRYLVALGCAALAAGCQSAGKNSDTGGSAAPTGGALILASDIQGNACRYAPHDRPEFQAIRYEAITIRCADGDRPSADLVVLQLAVGDNRREFINAWASSGLWRQLINQRMDCDDGRWGQLDTDVPAFLLNCKLKKGGWPYIALVASKGGRIFLTEGIPSAMPPIRSAILQMYDPDARRAAADALASGDSELAALEALLEGVNTFGASDLAVYDGLSRLGQLYNSTNNFQGAEDAYRRALEVHQKVLGVGSPESAEVLMNLALEVSNQERFEEADGLFSQAETLVGSSTDASDEARYLLYQAFHYANQRDYEQAMLFARESCDLRAALFEDQQQQSALGEIGRSTSGAGVIAGVGGDVIRSASGDVTEIAQCRYVESNMLLRIGLLTDAEGAIREAQRVLGDSRQAPEWWTAQVQITHGQIAAAQGRFDEGTTRVQDGIDIRTKLFGETRPTALGYQALGEIKLVEGKLDASLTAFRRMAAILRSNVTSGRGLTFEKLSPYLTALLDAGTTRPADRAALFSEMFEASQLVQEGVTAQTIARMTQRLSSGDSEIAQLMKRVEDVRSERDEYQFQLGNAQAGVNSDQPDPDLNVRIDELRTLEREASAKLRTLEQQLQDDFPNYSQISSATTVTFDEISALLRPDEALVAFSVGDRESFVFLLRKEAIYPARLAVTRRDLAAAVTQIRQPLERAVTGVAGIYDMDQAYQIYQALLAPIRETLAGVRHMIVQPTGSLLSLPFGMLITAPPPPGRENYTAAKWLAKEMATSITPSILAFVKLRQIAGQNRAPKPFIGFGDPTFEGSSGGGLGTLAAHCGRGDPIPPQLLRGLAPLPETAQELTTIARSLGAPPDRVFLGPASTEQNVRAADLDQYRVVFFATHGLLPGELNCQSEPALALSPPAAAVDSTKRDGLLDASEIAQLKMNADLVVLSACNTGGGGTGKTGGEALAGLARSFFFAGARTLMVSHWVVPSRSAVLLTTEMFRILAANDRLGASEALRQSQLTLLRQVEFAHPIFWAPFTVVGDGGAISVFGAAGGADRVQQVASALDAATTQRIRQALRPPGPDAPAPAPAGGTVPLPNQDGRQDAL